MKKLLLVLLVLIGACAQRENKPLVKIGKEQITVGQLEKVLPKQFTTPEQLNLYKDRLLQNLIDRKLFVIEAKALGLDKQPAVTDQYDLRKNDVLLRALYDQVIIQRAKVSSEEVRQGFQLTGEEVWLKLILLDTKEEADKVIAQLRSGVPFETLATKFSRHGTAPQGGDMGFGSLFELDPLLRRPVMALKPAQTTAPIKIRSGFAILKLIERRKKSVGDFKKESPRIKSVILQRKQNDLTQKFMDAVTAQLTYNPHGLDLLTKNPDSLTAADLEIWVTKNGTHYLKVATLIPEVKRMPATLDPQVKIYGIKRKIETDLLIDEAHHRRLEQTPSVQADLARLLDDILYSTLYQAEIGAPSTASDSEIAGYYQEHKKDYPKKTFDDVKEIIKSRLETGKRTARMQAYLEELKAKYPVIIDTKLLASIATTIKPKEKK